MRGTSVAATLDPMLELFQTEWCPASHRVRERLTELGVDYVIRQVPVDSADRDDLELATGSRSIPVVVFEDGSPVAGEQAILDCLAERFEEGPRGEAHRAKALKARRRYLEEECQC